MSKAVLVIDMPESCTECELCHEYRSCAVTGVGFFGAVINPHEERLKNCPLKPLPEKMQVYGRYPQPDGITPSYKIGYNRCLKEIGGEE